MSTVRKKQFRDGLKEFYKSHFKVDETTLSDVQRSRGLGLFYFIEVYNKKNPGVFPEDPEDYDSIIIDGSYDKGIDMVFSRDNHHFLVQLKYKNKYNKKKKLEQKEDVLYFRNVFTRIHPQISPNLKKSEKLLDAISDIDFKNDNFTLMFITLGSKNDDIRKCEDEGVQDSDLHSDLKDLSDRTTFIVLDEEELNMEYRDIANRSELDKVVLPVCPNEDGTSWFKMASEDGKKTAYIAAIKSSQIKQIYTEYRDTLFNLNIRNYVGDTSTNKGLKKSATEDSNNFFFYNNGLSAIAAKVKEDIGKNELTFKNFSIINGAQTFRSIAKAYDKNKSEVEKVRVMIRITVYPDFYKNTEFVDSITKFNNTQNAVKISDFRSNDGVQKSIHNYFQGTSFSGKTYHYKNKRSKDSPNNTIKINLDEFCKVIHSYLQGPIDCFGGLKYLYETNSEGGYYLLFADKDDGNIVDAITKETFKYYSSIWFLFEISNTIFSDIRKQRIEMDASDDSSEFESVAKRALQGKFMFMYVLGIIIQRVCKMKGITDQQFFRTYKVHKPDKFRADEKFTSLLNDALNLAADMLIQDYQAKMSGTDFVYRNWFRSKDTLKALKECLRSRVSALTKISEQIKI